MSTYPKLDPEFKKKWTDALRSGKYNKGIGELMNSNFNTFCCLGVACEIQGNALGELDGRELIDKYTNVSNIPKELRGTALKVGSDYNPLVNKLTDMNDSDDYTFNQIADWIDEVL